MIACASACAVSYAGNDAWFSGAASGTSLTTVTGSWKQSDTVITESTANGVTVAEGLITLENEDSSKLSLVPATAAPAFNDGLVTITSTAVLTPSEYTSLDSEITGAHAGFTVVSETVNNVESFYYCGYASGETPKWIKFTTGPQSASAETTFTIQLDYRTHTVKFLVGGSALTDGTDTEFDIGSSFNALSSVDAYGSGSLKSIATEYEHAVCAVGTTKYGSIADAIAANGTAATILDVTDQGISQSATAANGLPVAVCKALGISTTEANTPAVAIEPVASDSDASNINFKLADSVSVETGVAVTFAVKKDGTPVTGSPFASGAIKIPLASGTGVYTIEPAGVAAE
jgi:hypothetical protein